MPSEVQRHPSVEGQRLGLPGAAPDLLEQLACPPELRLCRFEVAEIPAHEADAQRQTGREVVVVRPGPLGQLVGGERLGEASGGGTGEAEVREQRGPLLVAAEPGRGGRGGFEQACLVVGSAVPEEPDPHGLRQFGHHLVRAEPHGGVEDRRPG